MTPEQMRQGVTRLEKRIEELENFNSSSIHGQGNHALLALSKSIEITLEAIFGNSSNYKRYKPAAALDLTPYFDFRGDPLSPLFVRASATA
jgi:hypothetical protein